MGAFFQSKDGKIDVRQGASIKVKTSTGEVSAVVESIYGLTVPFEIQIIEEPEDPVETTLQAGDYILVRITE